MMFFLARSALCIGVVAAAASGIGTGRFAAAIDQSAREAADGVGRACLASRDCLRAGTAALSAAAGAVPVAPVETSVERLPRVGAPARRGEGAGAGPSRGLNGAPAARRWPIAASGLARDPGTRDMTVTRDP